jgi:dipeptidyl aminopeptidase/acylaminoacyl peptidase
LTRKSFLIPLSLALFLVQARPAEKFALTIDNIMRGPALVGYEPAQVRWSADSRHIYFQWKQAADKEDAPMDTYTVNRDGSDLRKLTDQEVRDLPSPGGDTSKDKRYTALSRNGDIFIQDLADGKLRQITKTTEVESNPRFLPDGRRISYTRGGNLYVQSLETGFLEQMTDIVAASDAATPAAAGAAGGRGGRGGRGGQGGGRGDAAAGGEQSTGSASQDALRKEQKELFETVRERAAQREEAAAKSKNEPPQRKPFRLQARQTVMALQLTPDAKYVIATIGEAPPVAAKPTIVPAWITDTGYVEDTTGRSNVGEPQTVTRLAIIDVVTGEVKWVDHGQKANPPATGEREVNLSQPVWSEDGAKAFVVARSTDFKDRWVLALDAATGKTRVLANQHDDAWVGGPGGGGFGFGGGLGFGGGPGGGSAPYGWMKNDREVYFLSEKTGYQHLYAVSWDGGEARALTSGNWEVINVRQSRDKSKFYLTASQDSPFENHLYVMDGEGGPLTRLTQAPGKHTTTLSPDETAFVDLYSYTNQPPDLFLQENRPQAAQKRLTTSPAPEFAQYPWLDVPIVRFSARDGVQVAARLFKPANFKKGGPAVVFVHGAGYLQNVDRWWSTNYYREYMFNHILMERGYIAIDVDYRGSAGYGRDWRTAVYEHMGGKDLDDAVDAAKYVVKEHGVDARKIGIYGGSYGGFLTLMAMFTASDTFSAGAALRPVSDWAIYNHGYTAEILNLPQSDAEAYRRSSPIYFAEGLKGPLLICHGMVDNNVEFADTVRLVERLIELRKENWQLAVFPVESHSFVRPASWADEFKRILALFEKNLK